MHEWSIIDHPTDAELDVISDGVTRFGRAQAVGGNARPVACLVRDGSEIVAGGSGRTEFNRLFINYLWVTDALREQGIGSQILGTLESEAIARGCTDALIETLSDQTAALYGRLGYQPLAIIPNFVGPFTRHILIKQLGKHSA